MPADLDDRLRDALRDLAAVPPRPIADVDRDVRRRVARRRRRRRGALVAGAALVVVASVGVVVTSLTRPDAVTSDAPDETGADGSTGADAGPVRPLSIVGLDAVAGVDGTQRVEIRFDAPLPGVPVTYVPDITTPDAPGVAYTTQGPSALHVCEARHWFPGGKGTVDVLVPAHWLAEDTRLGDIPYTWQPPGPAAGKIPACGPFRGYVQFSIWGPASDDAEDVRVQVSHDGRALVVEISPG